MPSLPELPAEYKNFLKEHSGKQPYEFDGVGWWMSTSDQLLKDVSVDGKKHPSVFQLRGYVATLEEMFDGDSTTDADGNDYEFARLMAGLAIAEGDGDVLYLDPSDGFSVWCFHHDGGDVEKLAETFSDWIDEAVLDEDY